jgi:hypothetical protein
MVYWILVIVRAVLALAWLPGVFLAIKYRKSLPATTLLVLIGMGILLINTVVSFFTGPFLSENMQAIESMGISIGVAVAMMATLTAFLNAVAFLLVVVAAFTERGKDRA